MRGSPTPWKRLGSEAVLCWGRGAGRKTRENTGPSSNSSLVLSTRSEIPSPENRGREGLVSTLSMTLQNQSSLPHNMPNLASLKVLEVKNCAGITCFPRGGFPPTLETLRVYNCKKLYQPLEEWCLSGLGAPREFGLGGSMECVDEVVCFPSSADGNHAWHGALPSSLVRLDILGMKKAERLAGGLRTHLTSLRALRINGCKKMRFLPEEGLPDSLLGGIVIQCCVGREVQGGRQW